MGYYEAALALREQWMADDYDAALSQIKGRKNGLVLSNSGGKNLKYRQWGYNPDGSVPAGVVPGDHLYLPGVIGNHVTAPDHARLNIINDIDIRAKVVVPVSHHGVIAGKFHGTATGSYLIRWQSGSKLRMSVVTNELGNTTHDSPDYSGMFAVGTHLWVRATFDGNNGAGGHTMRWWYSLDNAATWVVWNETVGAGVATLKTTDHPFCIGAWAPSLDNFPLSGRVDRVQVFASIDGTDKRADVRFDKPLKWSNGQHTDPLGNVWTINRSALQNRLKVVANQYVEFPGTAGNYAYTPDANELDVIGDLDLRAKVYMPDWTPAATTNFVAKWATGGNSSYVLQITPAGQLRLWWFDTTARDQFSSVNTGLADGTTKWVRATLDVNNGAGQYEVKFWLSDDGVTWTQLGATRVGATGPTFIVNTGQAVEIGSQQNGTTSNLNGRVYEAEVWNGIPGVSPLARLVANPKFTALTSYLPYKEPGYAAHNHTSGSSGALSGGDSAAVRILSEDFDLRAKVAIDGLHGVFENTFFGRFKNTAENYRFYSNSAGTLVAQWWNGVAVVTVTSTVTLPSAIPVQGKTLWVRATLDGDNGLAGYTVKFYWSLDGVAWNQLGADVIGLAPTTVTFRGSTSFHIGSDQNNSYLQGKTYQGSVRTAIDAAVPFLSWNFEDVADGAANYTTPEGVVLTMGPQGRLERRTWSFARSALSERAQLRTGRYANFPGVGSNYLSVPTNPDLNILEDLAIVFDGTFEDITLTTEQTIMGKWSAANERSWLLRLATNGKLILFLSVDGSTVLQNTSTVAVNVADGAPAAFGATRRASDGRIQFWTAPSGITTHPGGTGWVQVGADVIGVTGPLFPSPGGIDVGASIFTESTPPAVKVRGARVYASITGADQVAGFDINDAMLMSVEPHNGFTDLFGNVWTVNRKAGKFYKTAIVDQSKILLDGIDDVLSAVHDALYDFGVADFTVAIRLVDHNPGGTNSYVAKGPDSFSELGWHLATSGSLLFRGKASAGTVVQDIGPVLPYGIAHTLYGRRTGSAYLGTYIGGSTAATNDTLTSLDTPQFIEVGKDAPYGAFEFIGLALAGTSLSEADIASLFDPDLELSITGVGDIESAGRMGGETLARDYFNRPDTPVNDPGVTSEGGLPWVSSGSARARVLDNVLWMDGSGHGSGAVESANAAMLDVGTKHVDMEWTATTGAAGRYLFASIGWDKATDSGLFLEWRNGNWTRLWKQVNGIATTLRTYVVLGGAPRFRIRRQTDGVVRVWANGVEQTPHQLTAQEELDVGDGGWAGFSHAVNQVKTVRNLVIDRTDGLGSPMTLQMQMSGMGDIASQESIGYPDFLEHGEFFADDFPEPNGALDPLDYTVAVSNSRVERDTNTLVMEIVGSSANARGSLVVNRPNYKNVDLLMKIRKRSNGTGAVLRGALRGDGTFDLVTSGVNRVRPMTGYGFEIFTKSGTVALYRWNEATPVVIGATAVTNDLLWDWIRFRVVGNQIYFRIWNDGSVEPATWNIIATDTTYDTSGAVQMSIAREAGSGHGFEIDNIALSDIQGIDLVGGIPSEESVGGFSVVKMMMTGFGDINEGAPPSLAQIKMFLRDLGDVVSVEDVPGLEVINMKIGPFGDIPSEELVWNEEGDGRLAFPFPYDVEIGHRRLGEVT